MLEMKRAVLFMDDETEGGAGLQKPLMLQSVLFCPMLTWLSDASANVAAACIRDGWFAMAGYGRMTLAYPDIARTIVAGERPALNRCCIACSKCTEIMRTPGGTPGCVIRDSEVYLPIYKKQCK